MDEGPEASLDGIFKNKELTKITLENNAKQARKAYKDNFKKMNLDTSYSSFFEILWYTQLPCFDVENVTSEFRDQYGMLKGCFWKGVEVPCSKVFDTFPTDQGMCCTFNIEKADQMFKNGKYTKMVNIMQKRDQNLSYDRAHDVPHQWKEDLKPISEAGISKGLQARLICICYTYFGNGVRNGAFDIAEWRISCNIKLIDDGKTSTVTILVGLADTVGQGLLRLFFLKYNY